MNATANTAQPGHQAPPAPQTHEVEIFNFQCRAVIQADQSWTYQKLNRNADGTKSWRDLDPENYWLLINLIRAAIGGRDLHPSDHEISRVAGNMKRFGGSFVAQIGESLLCADLQNRMQLIAAFPDLFCRYQDMK